MESFTKVLEAIDGVVWGVPLIVLIMGTGIFLTIRLGVLQFRKLGKAFKYMVKNEEDGIGEVTSFGALCTAMAATIGTGNIVGVATAVVTGGPGALFWMILAACLGMATKYSEGLLAVKYRESKPNGRFLGGPFYYIEKGMGPRWKWLGKLFAIFAVGAGLLGIGTITQVNGIASATQSFFDPEMSDTVSIFGAEYSIVTVITAIVVAFLTALVVIGGLKRIANVASIVVPFMAIGYVVICVSILIHNRTAIPGAITTVIESAFGLRAMAGGALGALMLAMQMGVARGIFSNEAGLGSAPIAAAAARTNEPVRQGLVSMTGTFIDTIIICTLTGLTIVITGSWNIGLDGVYVTMNAFSSLPGIFSDIGPVLLSVCLVFFAFTTILGWNFYGERCLEYIAGRNKIAIYAYRIAYIAAVFIGPYMTVAVVWGSVEYCGYIQRTNGNTQSYSAYRTFRRSCSGNPRVFQKISEVHKTFF